MSLVPDFYKINIVIYVIIWKPGSSRFTTSPSTVSKNVPTSNYYPTVNTPLIFTIEPKLIKFLSSKKSLMTKRSFNYTEF